MLSSINYCHKNNIVHRDYKPENILLEATKDFNQIKIIDFGISVVVPPDEAITEAIGTPYYIAPEVWKKHYNRECDVWACGVIMYILLSGTPPFNGSNDKEMKEKILNGAFSLEGKAWDKISEGAKDLIRKMLTYNPNERITAEEALHHPWLEEEAHSAVD